MVFNFLIQLNFQILAGVGRIRERAKILAITLVINLALNLFFILALKMGVRGSALAVGLSWIPLWYMSHRAVHEFTVGLDWKKLILNAIIAIPTLSIIYLATHELYIGAMTF
jgi:O-antigen/teichoic acid export membrane protein